MSKIVIQNGPRPKEVLPENVVVGVHGTPGCFTEEAILELANEFGVKKTELKYLVEAEKVMEAVDKGEVDRGIFAVANSGSGGCVFSIEAMGKYSFETACVFGMEVRQCLIVHPSVEGVGKIKKIFAHPQAIEQCQMTLDERYSEIEIVKGEDSDDTALCAKKIKGGELESNTATVGSALAAEKYGLEVLDNKMHHDPFNITTFVVIKKQDD